MEWKAPVPLNKGSMSAFSEVFEYDKVWYSLMVPPRTLESLKTFEVRKDDLILVSYPKCGTHWMLELLMLITKEGHLEKRGKDPVLGTELVYGVAPDYKKCPADLLVERPSPRLYRTHLPSKHLPPQVWTKKPRVVYVTRDPKDACASSHRFLSSNPANTSELPWEIVYNNFISDKAFFGNWCDHALGYWERRNDGHLFFVTYEEMKQDIRSVIRRLATFLGKTVSEEDIEKAVEDSSFDAMKKTYAKIEEEFENGKMFTRAFGIMPFLQKGVSGSWRDLFSEEQRKQMDKLMKERLVGTGLDAYYPYEDKSM